MFVIDSADDESSELQLETDLGELVTLPYSEARALRGGFCASVHKAQGFEIPAVIVCLHSSHAPQLLSRNLLYTAVTRAQQALHPRRRPARARAGARQHRRPRPPLAAGPADARRLAAPSHAMPRLGTPRVYVCRVQAILPAPRTILATCLGVLLLAPAGAAAGPTVSHRLPAASDGHGTRGYWTAERVRSAHRLEVRRERPRPRPRPPPRSRPRRPMTPPPARSTSPGLERPAGHDSTGSAPGTIRPTDPARFPWPRSPPIRPAPTACCSASSRGSGATRAPRPSSRAHRTT